MCLKDLSEQRSLPRFFLFTSSCINKANIQPMSNISNNFFVNPKSTWEFRVNAYQSISSWMYRLNGNEGSGVTFERLLTVSSDDRQFRGTSNYVNYRRCTARSMIATVVDLAPLTTRFIVSSPRMSNELRVYGDANNRTWLNAKDDGHTLFPARTVHSRATTAREQRKHDELNVARSWKSRQREAR